MQQAGRERQDDRFGTSAWTAVFCVLPKPWGYCLDPGVTAQTTDPRFAAQTPGLLPRSRGYCPDSGVTAQTPGLLPWDRNPQL